MTAIPRSVVPEISGSAPGTDDAVIRHQPWQLRAGVSAAVISMIQ